MILHAGLGKYLLSGSFNLKSCRAAGDYLPVFAGWCEKLGHLPPLSIHEKPAIATPRK